MATAMKTSLENTYLGIGDYLTIVIIRLQAQVFHKQIVNKAQPSGLSLVENGGK